MIQILFVLWFQLAAPPQRTPLSAEQQRALDAYLVDTARLRSGKDDVSVERVFEDALLLHKAFEGSDPALEDLSAEDYAALEARLQGIILNRDEVILTEPDVDYFGQLASKYGNATDRMFFAAYRKTFPDSVWPAYISQQTDFSGCSDFGEGHFVGTYAAWTEFRRVHPDRYRAEVDRRIGDIEETVMSTCACGDRDSVLRELEQFAARFPNSPVHDAMVKRIEALKAGTSHFRLHCISG